MVQDRRRGEKGFVCCSECGRRLGLPRERTLAHIAQQAGPQFEAENHVVQKRTRFEAVIAQLYDRLKRRRRKPLHCFISYASGVSGHERWVERLAADLQKAGIHVGRLGDAGELVDDQAKRAYRRRLAELRQELDEAKELGEIHRAEQLEDEIDALNK